MQILIVREDDSGNSARVWDACRMQDNTASTPTEPETPSATTQPATTPTPFEPAPPPIPVPDGSAPRERARSRRERDAGQPQVYRPSSLPGWDDRTQIDPPLAEDAVRVEYTIKIQGGKEVILDVTSRFDMPMALRQESLARTDSDFAEILNKIVFGPVLGRVREYLQKRFEDYAEVKTKPAESSPPNPNANGVGKRPMGTHFTMPAIDPTPPYMTPPNKAAQASRRNGG